LINIAADSQIPEIENRLGEFLDADYSFQHFDSNIVSPTDLKNIDALLVRSTLFVNQRLCEGTGICYVGSATAGINHLDIDYLDSQNITWSHAPGCNAFSVIHYVMAAIGELIKDDLFNAKQSIGIVGYGNIGRRLYNILKALNFEVYACDPFLSYSELVDLDSVLECDLITIHAPLSEKGKHPTSNLINESHIKKFLNKILINTSRGEIISEALVLQAHDLIYICDVWINEPIPNLKLIDKSYIATPHIAGYSIEGKLNGATIIAEECAKAFECLKMKSVKPMTSTDWPHGLKNIVTDIRGISFPASLFHKELDLKLISDAFKALSSQDLEKGFRFQRANHPPRHDFNFYSFEGMSKLEGEIDVNFFNKLRRA
jgi:erythronate-4-phosphate dehydrogenase